MHPTLALNYHKLRQLDNEILEEAAPSVADGNLRGIPSGDVTSRRCCTRTGRAQDHLPQTCST